MFCNLSLFLKNLYIFISLRENVCDSHLKKSRTWQEKSSLDGQVDTKDQSRDIRCRQSHLRISIRRYKPHRGRLQLTRRLFMVSCQSRTRMTAHIDSIAAVPECSAAARTSREIFEIREEDERDVHVVITIRNDAVLFPSE